MQETEGFSISEKDLASYQLILVVDDDVDFGSTLVQAIQEETPYKAIAATRGAQALQLLKHLKCDLFILDYYLPDINGVDLYHQLHVQPGHEQTPVLFLSADTMYIPPDMIQHEPRGYTKMTDIDQILGAIQTLLGSEK
jgi:CheY-like chemotaxis protein